MKREKSPPSTIRFLRKQREKVATATIRKYKRSILPLHRKVMGKTISRYQQAELIDTLDRKQALLIMELTVAGYTVKRIKETLTRIDAYIYRNIHRRKK